MAYANVQAWTHAVGSAGGGLSLSFTSNPTSNNLLVCCACSYSAANTLTIADNLGDSVSWSTAVGPLVFATGGSQAYIFYKVVGGSVSGKQVTVTTSAAGNAELFIAEYSGNATSTVQDGSGVSATGVASANPDPGSITVSAGSLAIGYVQNINTAFATAGTGYTRQDTLINNNWDAVEDNQSVSAGTTNPNWVHAADQWAAVGAAFKVAGGSATRPVKMAGEWGGFAGESGGFAG